MANVIEIVITGDEKGYTAAVKNAQQSTDRLAQDQKTAAEVGHTAFTTMQRGADLLRGALISLGAAFSLSAVISFIHDAQSVAAELNVISKRTRISVEDLSALNRIGLQSGVTLQDLGEGFRFLGRAIAQSRDMTSEQAKIFKLLGINTTEIIDKGGTLQDVWLRIADAFKNNLDETNRYLVAQALLGRGSQEQINLLSQGSEKLREQMEAQRALGVVTKETAEAADRAKAFWANFFQVIKDNTANAFNALTNFFQDVLAEQKKFVDRQLGIGTSDDAVRQAILNKAAEQAATRDKPGEKQIDVAGELRRQEVIEQSAQAEIQLRQQINLTQVEIIRLTEGEEAAAKAAIEFEETTLLNEIAQKKLDPSLAVIVKQLREEKEALFDATVATKKWNEEQERAQQLADIRGRIAKGLRDTIEENISNTKRMSDLEAERLRILGRTREAEELEIRARIEGLRRRREAELDNTKILDKQIEVEEARLRSLGEVTVNVGNEITRAVTDIFSAAINGTLKLSDIGKAGLLAVGRTVTEFFSGVLSKKLEFEKIVFSNLSGFAGQANAAVAAGAAAVPGGAAAGGGVGGAGGGLLGSIASSIGGLILPGLGGFAVGQLLGGGVGRNIGSTVGGIAGSLLGNIAIPSVTLGSTVFSGFTGTGIATSLASSALGTGLGEIVGATILPGIGAILGGLFGGLFGHRKIKKPRFDVRFALPPGATGTVEDILNATGGLALLGTGLGKETVVNRGGVVVFSGGTPKAQGVAQGSLSNISQKIAELIAPFKQVLELLGPEQRASLLATRFPGGAPHEAPGPFNVPLGNFINELAGFKISTLGGTSRDINNAAQTFFTQLREGFTQVFRENKLDLSDPQLLQRLQQQAEIQKQQTQEATRLQQIFDQATQSLEGQIAEQKLGLDMLGKSAEEAMAMRREFDLAKFAAQGLNEQEIQSLRVLGEQSDELTRQFQGRQAELAMIEQKKRDEEEITRRINERFLGLEGSLRSEVEQRRFDVMTFGLAPDEAAHARREFDLTRLGREGIGADQLDILRQLMSERDTLVQKLEELKTAVKESAAAAGPTHVDITINGDVSSEEDIREMTRRVTAVLEGQIKPGD